MSFSSLFAAVVPVLCGIFGAALSSIPVSLTGGVVPPPLLAFMPVYFWCLVRPDLMPVAAVFMIGLAQDVLAGGPPGMWTASFIAAYALLDRQRDSFAALAGIGAILGFALASLVACGTAYLIACFYFQRFPAMTPLVFQLLVTVVCYIPGLLVLNGTQHRIIGPLRSEF